MRRPADLVLVDGSSYVYRAFHALPPLTNSRGEPTGALFGVLNMLLKFVKDYSPRCMAVVFDASGRTFRDDLFAEYKAHRTPMPDDLRSQIEPLIEVLKAQGIPVLRIEGVEADDVIGTLACRAARAGRQVLISTGDKDMAQLVDDSITLVNTMTNTTLDRAGVKAKFDVYPEQIVDYLALVGDSSDNIPGIEKVGPKTAAKLLAQFGTLDELMANVDQVPGKVGENLRNGLRILELSRKLARIETNLDLPISIEQLSPSPPDIQRLRELYTRYELRSLLRQLDASTGAAPGGSSETASAARAEAASARSPLASVERQYETIVDWAQFERLVQRLKESEVIGLHTWATTGEYMNAEIVGLSFSTAPGMAAYVPLRHDYPGAPDQLNRERVLDVLRPILEDPTRPKLGHHFKHHAHVFLRHGIRLAGMRYDAMLESYVWNSVATRHDLETTAERYLGLKKLRYEDFAGKGVRQLAFNEIPVDRAAEYACDESDVMMRVHMTLWPQLTSVPSLVKLYDEIEQPLVPVLLHMEETGVLVSRDLLTTQSREINAQLQELLLQARKEAGCDLNVESPKQLQQVLYEKLQLPVLRKTPTGQPSTAEDVLEELAAFHPLPRIILDYRELAKLKSTYTDKLPEQINARTGRIHTCYYQAVAQTGRLSSADPNLQNIPVRRGEGRRIRQAFIAPPGHVLMAADYSQIELRIMAHLSGDEGLLQAFAEDRDVHQATAAEIFAISPESVTPDHRRVAKVINFGLIYGMSPFGLARQLGIDRGAAQQYVERYFARYPGVKRFMDETRTQARETGYVETVFGRRLYLPDIRSRNKQLQQYAERSAINAPMQGTAADIIKRAMIVLDDWLQREEPRARMIMQVHDELVFEVEREAAEHIAPTIRRCMVEAAELKVPLKVDIGFGANWDEAH